MAAALPTDSKHFIFSLPEAKKNIYETFIYLKTMTMKKVQLKSCQKPLSNNFALNNSQKNCQAATLLRLSQVKTNLREIHRSNNKWEKFGQAFICSIMSHAYVTGSNPLKTTVFVCSNCQNKRRKIKDLKYLFELIIAVAQFTLFITCTGHLCSLERQRYIILS